jgi:hypothetical protein
MIRYKSIAIVCLAIFLTLHINAQSNANGILRSVYNKMQKAKDYTVQAKIKVDMPFIRILPVDVTIYFKQKDKFKVESKSIAIVPRQGFDQVQKLLADTNSFTTMIQGRELIGNVQTSIINVIPLSDTNDLILAKLWIDLNQNVILKSQLTTRSSGTILTEYIYKTQIDFGLPDQMVFTVDVNKFKMPKNLSADMSKSEPEKNEKDKEKENKKGKIFVELTNYQVNKGIPDNVF